MDFKCLKCGEPWDTYGLYHGDVTAWEADMITNGVGCPACQGKPNGYNPTFSEFDDNSAATEGEGVLFSNDSIEYIEPEKHIFFNCSNCKKDIGISQSEIFYDGKGNKVTYSYREKCNVKLDRLREEDDYGEYIVDGLSICNKCLNTDFSDCEACLETHRNDTGYYSQSLKAAICNKCLENGAITYCEDCNCEEWENDICCFVDNEGQHYSLCDWCFREREREQKEEQENATD